MSPELYLAYLLACVVIIIVPGPTVTLIIANSLSHGVRAGLLNVAGTQLGIAFMIALVGFGLASLIEALGWWFEVVRLAGAAYLIWLGVKLIRSTATLGDRHAAPAPRGGFFLQGFWWRSAIRRRWSSSAPSFRSSSIRRATIFSKC